MIYDHIQNAQLYTGLNEKFAAAFDYLASHDVTSMEPGKYEIQGSELFLLLQSYETKTPDQGFWEAHRSHIDIQVMLEGTERMGVAHAGHLTMTEDHLDEKDYKVLVGHGDYLDVKEGCFVIFYPDDAHMPCLTPEDGSQTVKKAVFKVKI